MAEKTNKQTNIRLGKRMSPRPELHRRVLLRTPAGQVIETQAFDLSAGGLRIQCDMSTAYMLNFDDTDLENSEGPIFDVRLTLPFADGLVEFRGKAQLIHQHARTPEDVALGFRFVDLDDDDQEHLQAFLRYLLRNQDEKDARDTGWLEPRLAL